MTLIAFLIGCLLVPLLGLVHHFSILAIIHLTPNAEERGHAAVFVTFTGLFALHLIEILAFAGIYAMLLSVPDFGSFAGTYTGSWEDLIYFSGINFVTLGYTEITVEGPIRMISLFQALGGFMALTWSATLIYSVSGTGWHSGGYTSDESPENQ